MSFCPGNALTLPGRQGNGLLRLVWLQKNPGGQLEDLLAPDWQNDPKGQVTGKLAPARQNEPAGHAIPLLAFAGQKDPATHESI